MGTVEHHETHEVRTTYAFDALSRLVRVTDAEGNETRVGFDLGGRRTDIVSPDAGHTSFAYDPAGNLIERITPNLRGHGAIAYGYHFGRLETVRYPDHEDSNVTITYGTAGDGPNALGRIRTLTDRAGTTELEYDALGRATRETRTVGRWSGTRHQDTYVTQTAYDTWGRVQQMVYPDGEVLTYRYDTGGQVRSAEGVRYGTAFPYVRALEYDRFGAVVYEEAGNGTRSHRTYDATTRRVDTIEAGDFQNVRHTFDDVGQLTRLVNDVSSRRTDRYGGRVTQDFEYDPLERLTRASGTWDRPEGGTDRYSLTYQYDDIHNITRKTQTHEVLTRGNSHPIPQHGTTYDLTYTYGGSRPHAPSRIGTATFSYDDNGNQTARDDSPGNRRRRTEWDEESLPRAITVAGHRTEFVYDASGSRVAKIGAQGETVYVNPTWTVRNGTIATKHVYVGGRRVASKILPGVAPSSDDPDLVAGMLGRWYEHRSDSGHEHANNTTMNPHYRVPTSMPTNGTPESNFVYFYHGDLIGSVSYVTDQDGELFEHNQFFASGEQWVSQNSNSERLPFLYTATELDQETDLYAFGVRMYDPREQVWLSPDSALPAVVGEDDDEGRAYDPRSLSLFSFAFHNPVTFSDDSGLYPELQYDESEGSCAVVDVPGPPAPASSGQRQNSTQSDRETVGQAFADGFMETPRAMADLSLEQVPGMVLDAAVMLAEHQNAFSSGRPWESPAVQAGVESLVDTVETLASGDANAIARLGGRLTFDVAAAVVTEGAGRALSATVRATRITTPVAELRAAGLRDAHHVIQDAAVRDLPGYSTGRAPGVRLDGPANSPGTPHHRTRGVQRQAGGGTYAAERRIGYKALRRAGFSPADARLAIQEADEFFRSIGVGPNTRTRIPGDRH